MNINSFFYLFFEAILIGLYKLESGEHYHIMKIQERKEEITGTELTNPPTYLYL